VRPREQVATIAHQSARKRDRAQGVGGLPGNATDVYLETIIPNGHTMIAATAA